MVLAPQTTQKYYRGFGRVVPQHEDRQSSLEVLAPFWHGEDPFSFLSPPSRISLLCSTPRPSQLIKLCVSGFNTSIQSALPHKPRVHHAEKRDPQTHELDPKSACVATAGSA